MNKFDFVDTITRLLPSKGTQKRKKEGYHFYFPYWEGEYFTFWLTIERLSLWT